MVAPPSQDVWQIIDELWARYDEDLNGVLDKNETHKFLNAYLALQGKPPISQDDFYRFYAKYDQDKNGLITKLEMVKFIQDFNIKQIR